MLVRKIWFSNPSKELRSLRRVLNELGDVHKDYIAGGAGDCPYWYGERPHISLLSAAFWRQRGIALDEYGGHKIRERKRKPGRCDLWVKLNNADFGCEAKRLWLNLGKNIERSTKRIYERLDQAKRDVGCLLDAKGKGLALCFVTPVVHKSKLATLDTQVRNLIKKISSGSQYDALLWIGVKGQKHFEDQRNFLYPGLLLAIREVR